ncbi:Long-chain-fatty-acid--CoA ligase [Roseibacterium elongatum DSM 19469]|uniref:Long-chain-fatty-acid--CoA ligase n=1 Tax=Roseicyclus elongatus DSM 19469 TaxID=1294273 RepID=W8S2R5_9RHOB|nr:non-ribosomal peptide synthetase [Roseibacterium elongatum]AHM04472.1 Long-chain-fatty-acid--CoA ligase [Roseibacterium elongatum DSM 19469]
MSDDLLQKATRARARMAADRQAVAPAPEGPVQLTPAQTGMWMAERFGKAGARFTQVRAWRICGALDLDALDRAIGRLLQRHDAFHLRVLSRDGQGMPDFSAPPPWSGVEAELCPRGEPDTEAWVQRRITALSQRRFDIASGPLSGFHLLICGPDAYVLVGLFHHLMSDHRSFTLMAEDLSRLYALEVGASPDPQALPDPGQYRAFLAGRPPREADPSARQPLAEPVWPTQVEGPSEQLDTMAHFVEVLLDPTESDAVGRAARACDATVFGLTAALFQVLVGRLCDQSDVSVSVSRTIRSGAASMDVIGMFVENVALTASLGADRCLADLAGDVGRALAEIPLGAAPILSEGPAGASVIYYGDPTPTLDLPGCRVARIEPEAKPVPVAMQLAIYREAGRLRLRLHGQRRLFSRDALDRALGAYRQMLVHVITAETPATVVPTRLPLVPEGAQRADLARHATAPARYPDAVDLATLFLAQVRHSPDAPALRTPDLCWSYRDLAAQSLAISDWLRQQGLAPGERVGLSAERGADHIRALLGAVLAGLVVVPLDPTHPPARLRDMIDIAGCRRVVGAGGAAAQTDGIGPILRLPPVTATDPGAQLPDHATGDPDGTAVIVFTSGSTGRPKGVATPHRGIARLAAGLTPAPPGPGDRVPQLASPGFDGAFIEIWGALLNGAELVSPEGPLGDARAIGDHLERYEITKAFVTTGLFNLLVDTRPEVFRTLRWLAIGGEAASREHAERFLRDHPGIPLYNVYGPTENSALTTMHRITAGGTGPVPLGRPLPNNLALVLDRAGHVLPAGFVGELWIGGAGLAKEYVAQPDLTAERFRTFPARQVGLPDHGDLRLYQTGDRVSRDSAGCLHFHGRVDGQIKFNGHRIEPAEIEDAIQRCAGIETAALLPLWSEDGGRVTGLAAAVVSGEALDVTSLRLELARSLPRTHLPTEIHAFATLPLTPNGKLDRAALRDTLEARRAAAAATAGAADLSHVDERLVAAWTDTLGTPPSGPDTDFFVAGGNSLSAMQLLLAAEEVFDRRLDINRFSPMRR